MSPSTNRSATVPVRGVISADQVAAAHDAMASEYDDLDDLWYPYLFATVHEFIATHLQFHVNPLPEAIDVGCGTGFQAFLLARAGYSVRAFDLAEGLLDVARAKSREHTLPPLEAPPLFRSKTWPRAVHHHQFLAARLEEVRQDRTVRAPTFTVGDIQTFDFGEGTADVITCCGSVLSFVEDYATALARMVQGLKPGGFLFLEVEQKHNMDLIWPAIDRLAGGRLGYDQSWREILSNLASSPRKSVVIAYPFALHDGSEVVLPIWLFSVQELSGLFSRVGLRVVDRLGIHAITCLIPSTVLHEASTNRLAGSIYRPLEAVDRSLARVWPFWRLGCSVVYCLEKV